MATVLRKLSPLINSLAPGKFEWHFIYVIFKRILVIAGWGISCEISLIWMSLDFTDNQSTVVQVMAWCRQTTGHYLSQCWPRSLSPYGVTRPQLIEAEWYVSVSQAIFGSDNGLSPVYGANADVLFETNAGVL